MPLASGTRLGPYEITAQIGAGGMGEVYRATDTKLKRQVAIKILPALLAADADRLARFQREAEVLASLNHPNIAQIYGLEDTTDANALVMELVEGATLVDRIAQGAIPLDEALAIARQIAEALEAAHEQGIIHRDLKPANIKVRPDGTVKLLDFGLAKLNDPHGPNAPNGPNALSLSPTLSMQATMAGVILGTAAYMSPEQARGKTVDKRADVWAFGCVLYEMLTARRPFEDEDVSLTLSKVLQREPDFDTFPAEVPPNVRQTIRLCLRKPLRERIPDIGAVRLALDGAFETAAPRATTPAPPFRGAGVAWLVAAVAVLGAAALAVPVMRHLREAPPTALPETRTEILTPSTTDPVSFALSPDGRQLVLWRPGMASRASGCGPWRQQRPSRFPERSERSIRSGRPTAGRLVSFADGKLKRFDLGAGQPQTLSDAVPRGGAWNSDGVILFARTTVGPLFRVPASGGNAVAVTKLDRQVSHRFPNFLEDSRHFVFYVLGTPETRGIYLGSLDSGETTRLTAGEAAGVYMPSGWLAWLRGGTLVVQRLDIGRKELLGDPVTLADPVAFEGVVNLGAVSVSANGLIAYRSGAASRRQLAWFDRTGKALGTMGGPDENSLSAPRLSPDGGRVAVFRVGQGNRDIWMLDGARTSRFTFDAALDMFPIWSPDGSRVAFFSNRKGHWDLYLKASSGAGGDELLLESPQDKSLGDWSADGRFMLYMSADPQTDWDLWVLPMEGDRKPWTFLKTDFSERAPQFSRMGAGWRTSRTNQDGPRSTSAHLLCLQLQPPTVTRPPGQWPVSAVGGISPRWGPDGKELYYIGPDGQMMASPIRATAATLEPGAPKALFPTHAYGGGADNQQGRQYDVAHDGRFLINTVLNDSAAAPITLIQNWRPPAK